MAVTASAEALESGRETFYAEALVAPQRVSRSRRVARWLGRLATGAVASAGLVLLLALTLPFLLGYRNLVVMSGSMEPTIHTGDIVAVRPIQILSAHVGDVLTFRDPENQSRLITHRLRALRIEDGAVMVQTKGDANTAVDTWRMPEDGHVGRVAMDLGGMGYLLSWVSGPLARILSIVLPCLWLGRGEIARIWSHRPRAHHGRSR